MKNKVVIVTGASSGIGLACAMEFAGRGARVVLAARSYDKVASVAEELISSGFEAFAVKTDVSKEEDCRKLVESAVERFGGVDVLINNAGISMRAMFEDTSPDILKKLMDVNFWGTVHCTKYALPWLLERKGSVVGVSSVAGYVGLPARTGYSASKFAMQGFLEALRVENLKRGLHVLIAAPGFTASNVRKSALVADGSQQGESPREEKRMMSPEEVALHLRRAVEKRKSTLILTFEGKFTVMMKKFAPRLLEKIIYNHMAKEPDSPFR